MTVLKIILEAFIGIVLLFAGKDISENGITRLLFVGGKVMMVLGLLSEVVAVLLVLSMLF